MSPILLFVLFLFAGEDSDLVKAAKANGGLKKPIPKKTITNEDVKKSKGKIVELPAAAPASAGAAQAEARPPALTQAEFDARKKVLAAAQKTVVEKEANVAELEKDLYRIEQSYYESSDPNLRDSVIAQRFDQTKKQLDAARAELAGAREVLAALNPPKRPESP